MLHFNNSKLVGAAGTDAKSKRPTRADKLRKNLAIRLISTRRAFVDGRREQNSIEHIVTLPSLGESVHMVIDGRFEPCDLIPAIRRLSHPATIASLDIVTLSFNPDNLACLCNGLDQGKIGKCRLVTSHYFEKAERELFQLASEELGSRGGTIHGARVHAKIILMEMSDGRHFTIEGSGNLRSCKSIEQFALINSPELLTFHRDWINDVVESVK